MKLKEYLNRVNPIVSVGFKSVLQKFSYNKMSLVRSRNTIVLPTILPNFNLLWNFSYVTYNLHWVRERGCFSRAGYSSGVVKITVDSKEEKKKNTKSLYRIFSIVELKPCLTKDLLLLTWKVYKMYQFQYM